MTTNPARTLSYSLPIVKDTTARPRTRADCIGGPRPCPHRTCRYHLGGELAEGHQGSDTCVLDVTDRGEADGPTVGAILGISRQRVQQIEAVAIQKIQRHAGRGVVLALASHADDSPGTIVATVEQAKATDRRARERSRKDRERRAKRAHHAPAAAPGVVSRLRDGWWRDIDPALTAEENSRRLGASLTAVYRRAVQQGLRLRPADGKGGRAPGCHNPPGPKPKTVPRLALIRRLRAGGVSHGDIARELGISRQAVQELCARHGIDKSTEDER